MEFRYPVPGAEAKFQPTVTDDVHNGRLFRQFDRMMKRGNHNRGPDTKTPGPGGHGGGKGQRLRQVSVVKQMVFAQPDGVASQPIRFFAHLQGEAIDPGWI
jgi:hypothetical protein